jgi:C-terminal processing protease CtpA/Prc
VDSGDWKALFVGKSGSVRHVRVKKAGTGAVRDLAVTLAPYTYDLVSGATAPVVFQAGPDHKVGYVRLMEFRPEADDQLRSVMRHFQQAGVTDFILDLRYNGGGDLKTAELLCNLLRGTAAAPLTLPAGNNPNLPMLY